MRSLPALVALVLALSCGIAHASPPASPADSATAMHVGRLPGGGTFIVRATGGPAVTAIELWYRAPATGFAATPVQGLSHLAAEAVAASIPITGRSLSTAVFAVGGTLSITAYPGSLAVSALVPSSAAASILRTMTAVYFAPVITDDGLLRAQNSVVQEDLRASFDPDAVLRDALFGQLFTDGPAHYPSVTRKSDVRLIPFAAVTQYATRAFRVQNAVLVLTGDVAPSIVASAVTGRLDATAADGPFDSTPIVDQASISRDFYEPALGLAWLGPPISDERSATAMDFIADYLCRDQTGRLVTEIAQADPNASVGGQFITLHDPGVLVIQIATLDQSKIDQAKMRAMIDDAVAGLRTPLSTNAFAAAKAAFAYHLLSDLQTPLELADNFGWYTIEGNMPYAPLANGEAGAYFRAIDSLTPDFIASVAQRYLVRPSAVATLTVEPSPAPPLLMKGAS